MCKLLILCLVWARLQVPSLALDLAENASESDDTACALQKPQSPGTQTLTHTHTRKPTYDDICKELRSAMWPSANVLCKEDFANYAWNVYNRRCAELTPAFIVLPTKASDVQQAVILARKHSLPISFRGSGHSYNCIAFRKGSLNLDMRTMGNAVTFEETDDGSYAHLAPGANFQDMLGSIPKNSSFTHGTCPSVGVMGYHLQGGWGATTATWANESISSMQVVTSNGSLLELDASSVGAEAQLWKAMRVAGSSFGIVTSLTIKLFSNPERPYLVLPVNNSFDELMAVIPDAASFGWVGLTRWDQVFFDPGQVKGSGWLLQIALKDAAKSTKAAMLSWIMKSGLQVVSDYSGPTPNPLHELNAGTWKYWRFAFSDSGSFSRFYELSDVRGAATVLHKFFAANSDQCRYNLGPLKGTAQLPIVTVECNTPRSVRNLKQFVRQHANILQPNKPGSGYVNLPLDASREFRSAFWPQYEELSAIKEIWDPDNFFNMENGIHPPAQQ